MRFIAENSTPQALSTREVERASAVDEELSNVRESIKNKQWQRLEKKRYLMVRNKLSIVGKLALKGAQIIIPLSLQDRVLELAHEGHPEIVAMKRRLHTKVWWPNCDKDAEKFCDASHVKWFQHLHNQSCLKGGYHGIVHVHAMTNVIQAHCQYCHQNGQLAFTNTTFDS